MLWEKSHPFLFYPNWWGSFHWPDILWTANNWICWPATLISGLKSTGAHDCSGEKQHLDSSVTNLEALGMWGLPIILVLYWSEHSVLWAQVPSELCKRSPRGLMLVAFVCSRRRLKRHPHKSLQKRIRGRPHLISTSAAVGSFEGRRHCSDHLLSVAMVFPLSSGVGRVGGGGVGLGGEIT